MMGPWLIFQYLNGATLALFNGVPSSHTFCKFIELARVNILGVVPSLVKSWFLNSSLDDCNWDQIKLFSSTGEASDPEMMLWLMSRPG
jgi:acetyl-CoA synthetase